MTRLISPSNVLGEDKNPTSLIFIYELKSKENTKCQKKKNFEN